MDNSSTASDPKPRSPILSFVVAASENGVIGAGNKLPWHLPDDLKYFKRMTLGKPILMGRKTYESIGRPLPNRTNIVMTRRRDLVIPGCVVVNTLEEAKAAAAGAPELVIIGGAELFEQTLPSVDIIHLTRVHAQVEGDTRLPGLSRHEWRERVIERHQVDAMHAFAFSFIDLERISPALSIHTPKQPEGEGQHAAPKPSGHCEPVLVRRASPLI